MLRWDTKINLSSKIPDLVSYPLGFTIFGFAILNLPLFGTLLLFPFLYFIALYDLIVPGDFTSNNGGNVDCFFAGCRIETTEGWLFYLSFFFLFGLLIALILSGLRKLRKSP